MRAVPSGRMIAGTTTPEGIVHRYHHRQEACAERSGAVPVHITVLGGFAVVVNGVPTAAQGWARRSAAALVKVLALAPGHRLHREQVMDLLWPDESPDRTAPRLHKAAHFARRAAGGRDAVVLRDDLVCLFPDADLTVDAIRFEQLARVAVSDDDPAAAREALAWYGGDLLPGDRYEEWANDRRELLHLRHLDVLRVAGDWRELAERAPTDEEAHTELMRRHLASGDPTAALRQYEHLERVLGRELGVEPGEAARRARVQAGPGHGPPSGPRSAARMSGLLAELAELARRERAVLAELAELAERADVAAFADVGSGAGAAA